MIESEYEEKLRCGVCGLEYFDEISFSKFDWIKCQKLKTWFNKVCIGPPCRKSISLENEYKIMKDVTEIACSVIKITSHFSCFFNCEFVISFYF
jgi:hypothetical protein